MKNSVAISLVALLLSTVAILTSVLSEPVGLQEPSVAPGNSQEELLAKVNVLSQEIRRLQDQVGMLKTRSEGVERVRAMEDYVTSEVFAAFQEKLYTDLSKENMVLDEHLGPLNGVSPEITAQVSSALEDIRESEKREGARKWASGRAARLQNRMPEVSQQLGLDAYQQDLMTTALEDLYQSQADIKAGTNPGAQNGLSPRETWTNDINNFLDGLDSYLTPEQITLYQSLGGDLFPGGGNGKE